MRLQTSLHAVRGGSDWDNPLDAIAEDARQGDASAIELFVQLARENTTAGARLLVRNHVIGLVDTWLTGILAGPAPHVRACIVAEAGQALASRRTLPDAPPFAVLDNDERRQLEKMIRPFMGWVKWPKKRQVIEIIANRFAVLPP